MDKYEVVAVPRDVAAKIAWEFIERIKEFCDRVHIAGSLRRKKPLVHDIDLVVIPAGRDDLIGKLFEISNVGKRGEAIITVRYKGVQIDIYIADKKTWATLLLIRTGSIEHNIKLCKRARAQGMYLKADGRGLCRVENCKKEFLERVAWKTEEDIFKALGIEYVSPEKR